MLQTILIKNKQKQISAKLNKNQHTGTANIY